MCSIHIGRTKVLLRKIFVMQDRNLSLSEDSDLDSLEYAKSVILFRIRQISLICHTNENYTKIIDYYKNLLKETNDKIELIKTLG